ncbi:MAG: hypothetical protein RMJ60_10305, partial [Anaerolineales bacterium]|nr:hypothetical protein [Anaerolineales bacterium]
MKHIFWASLLLLLGLTSCVSTFTENPDLPLLLVYARAGADGQAMLVAWDIATWEEPRPLSFALPADCRLFDLYPSPTDY